MYNNRTSPSIKNEINLFAPVSILKQSNYLIFSFAENQVVI